jgi:putative hydrolase of the HAD superfamily
MERNSVPFIKSCLSRLERLDPQPTAIEAKLNRFEGIKAVLFDIYGTLLISASGDIGSTLLREEAALEALREASVEVLRPEEAGRKAIDFFIQAIRDDHTRLRDQGVPYPEVDITEIWMRVLRDLEAIGTVAAPAAQAPATTAPATTTPTATDTAAAPEEATPAATAAGRCAFRFETLSNPVYPMPGMRDLLEGLKRRNLLLGLISNAQFFTPIILNHFVNFRVSLDDEVPPFHRDLTIFSYKHESAKPDPRLFNTAVDRLEGKGITAGEALFVGNDMLNDIWPACDAGFRTALFAGDARSLRLRQGHPRSGNRASDAVVTSLNQIYELLE